LINLNVITCPPLKIFTAEGAENAEKKQKDYRPGIKFVMFFNKRLKALSDPFLDVISLRDEN